MSTHPLNVIALAVVLSTAPVAAQVDVEVAEPAVSQPPTRQDLWRTRREQKRDDLTPYVVSTVERRIRALERVQFPRNIFVGGYRGFRPIIGGLPSGSGFVVGGGYVTGRNSGRLQVEANARRSTYGYTAFDATATFPPKRSDLPVRGYVSAEVRDLKALNFFGLGNGSRSGDGATYRLEDRTITAGATASLSGSLTVGAHGGWLRADASPGTRRTPLNRRFDPAGVPGFGFETDYGLYGGHVELDLRIADGRPPGCRHVLTRNTSRTAMATRSTLTA